MANISVQVDDDRGWRALVFQALQTHGHQVQDGLLPKTDLLIVEAPGSTGDSWERFLKEIAIRRNQGIKVWAVDGQSDRRRKEDVMLAGAALYTTKTRDAQQIINWVDHIGADCLLLQ